MVSTPDITQAFIDKKYLVPSGPADILLNPHKLTKFLSKHGLLKYFIHQKNLKTAHFREIDPPHSEHEPCIVEFSDGRILKSASIQVMCDSFFREEHLCPIRIAQNKGQYELQLAPLSQQNIAHLDHFYQIYRINIVHAYRVRRDILNLPFKSGDLPNCLSSMFIDQNVPYEEEESGTHGITVSDDQFNPDATIMNASPEDLMKLFKK
ncbi:MAG: hypothetical protein GY814_02730 [Gammaproteobacteria bacterium]|nr:hypothetical protein [Gammaproteobacteria bacterium]